MCLNQTLRYLGIGRCIGIKLVSNLTLAPSRGGLFGLFGSRGQVVGHPHWGRFRYVQIKNIQTGLLGKQRSRKGYVSEWAMCAF